MSEWSHFLSPPVRFVLFGAAGGFFLDGILDRFEGFAAALLDPAQRFIVLPLGALKIVIGKLGLLLFQLALSDVPVVLEFEYIHYALSYFVFVCESSKIIFPIVLRLPFTREC
jgi:hypothetical protein